MILQGKTEELGEKSVPVPVCPQIPHGLTQASAVRPVTNCLSHGTGNPKHKYNAKRNKGLDRHKEDERRDDRKEEINKEKIFIHY